MGRAVGPGDGVVDIAELCGYIAVGEPAAHIAHPDELGQPGRGPITGFGGVGGPGYRAQGGSGADQLGQQGPRHGGPAQDHPVPGRADRIGFGHGSPLQVGVEIGTAGERLVGGVVPGQIRITRRNRDRTRGGTRVRAGSRTRV